METLLAFGLTPSTNQHVHSISLGNSFVNSSKTTSEKTTSAATTTSLNRTTSTGTLRNVTPNKSTLFGSSGGSGGGMTNGGGIVSVTPPSQLQQQQQQQQSPKPAIGFGKPNFAPKPPGLQQLALVNGHQRPVVVRHHSMKTTRYRTHPVLVQLCIHHKHAPLCQLLTLELPRWFPF